jgi:SNF2 family DNA or RNA helicase
MATLKPLWDGFRYQDHQEHGIRWMIEREEMKPSGGLLCDEMGLGKTIQILGLIRETKPNVTLLLAPLCTLDQWQQTAERCGFCVWRCHPSNGEWDLPKNFHPHGKHLYVLNYERAVARPGLIARRIWPRVVFDEAHRMADPKGSCFGLANETISAQSRWFLTATPIVNNLKDALSLFHLLGMKELSATQPEQLHAVIEKRVLCRTMEDLRGTIRELPDAAKEFQHVLDFETADEAEFYRGIQGIIQRRFRMLQHEEGGQAEMFRLIMRLRQISIHPQVYIGARKREWSTYGRPDWEDPSTKFVKLKELIERQSSSPHRWIVFCHFHEEMTLLQTYLENECSVVRECSLYSGALSAKQKAEALATSKEPLVGFQQEVLLVQLQSGGVGLNLQHCDRVVFMGPWWTAALMDQAIGRAVRIGQTETVEVHRLILKEEASMNIDRRMLAKAELKRDLCRRFLGLARGPVSDDPTAEDDDDTSVDSFERLPVLNDDENPM